MDKGSEIGNFLAALGLDEEPMGMYYTDIEPEQGTSPDKKALPTAEQEAKGEVNFGAVFANFSCVIGKIWLARKKKTAAYFDSEHYGCLGGAFYLGFLKPQLETVARFISTGIPGRMEGEHYFESPEVSRNFFATIDPRPAPARFCVFKPMSLLSESEAPEVVTFFARPEIISGLNQLAVFVTNDFEAVASPFGAGCTNLVSWPLRYLSQGKLKAVLGGWDPSERKFLKPDEITFSVPYEMFGRMVARWPESFLKTDTWTNIKKRIALSKNKWGETAGPRQSR
ncbi:MAG: DUF169 domain-containing protein [Syntrophorhabdales bacterium]|jgi:uncharacterized protein (DUF169 family)